MNLSKLRDLSDVQIPFRMKLVTEGLFENVAVSLSSAVKWKIKKTVYGNYLVNGAQTFFLIHYWDNFLFEYKGETLFIWVIK